MKLSLAVMSVAMITLGCAAPAPRPIAYGTEPCAHCHMTITDARFAAQLVTRKGRVSVFDDPLCLATFYAAGTIPPAEVALLFVNDFVTPDSMLDATTATYLRTDRVSTPMGGGIIALRSGLEADSVRTALGGEVLHWPQLLALGEHH
ncbi:MAG: nitrous oxide reductase accessory protein NosL [Gemmatimonadales bacterium]